MHEVQGKFLLRLFYLLYHCCELRRRYPPQDLSYPAVTAVQFLADMPRLGIGTIYGRTCKNTTFRIYWQVPLLKQVEIRRGFRTGDLRQSQGQGRY